MVMFKSRILPVGKVSQLHALLLDVQEVAVCVQVVKSVRIDRAKLLEIGHSLVHLSHVVEGYCHLGKIIFRVWKMFRRGKDNT